MKIVQINSTYGYGSTGKICKDISEMLSKNNIENYVLYTIGKRDVQNVIKCSNLAYIKLQALKSKVLGNYGFNSKKSTKKIISELERINPDIVHLHNIHSHDCNLVMLFNYLKKINQKIIWTFHDCWAFTGYCPNFDMVGCNKWRDTCKNCPQYKEHSFFFDESEEIFKKKELLFSGANLTITTPSQWMANNVKHSFLKNSPVKVINNGIDIDVFFPILSSFRKANNISDDTFVILGVAIGWSRKKGLDVFIELNKRLPKEKYKIVLVGTNDSIDNDLPCNIISVHRTQNQHELAEIYSTADLFVNPSREDSFGLVNAESLACGTPVLTFNTGGCPEVIDETCGSIVANGDIDALEKEIISICENKPYTTEACVARANKYDKNKKYIEYLQLYKDLII